MKIGILSDTHRKLDLAKDTLDMLIENGAEFIIHAGDIEKTQTLDMLENSPIDYVAVYGNNDAHLTQYHENYNLQQEPYYFKIADTKFKLMHLPFYMAPDADVIIFGHTHTFEVDFKNETLFLNPGEVCARSKPLSECAMLQIENDTFSVTHYFKQVGLREYDKEEFRYNY